MADEAKLKEALSLARQAVSAIQECIEEYGGHEEMESPEYEEREERAAGGYSEKSSSNRLGAMLTVMGKKKGNASR